MGNVLYIEDMNSSFIVFSLKVKRSANKSFSSSPSSSSLTDLRDSRIDKSRLDFLYVSLSSLPIRNVKPSQPKI